MIPLSIDIQDIATKLKEKELPKFSEEILIKITSRLKDGKWHGFREFVKNEDDVTAAALYVLFIAGIIRQRIENYQSFYQWI